MSAPAAPTDPLKATVWIDLRPDDYGKLSGLEVTAELFGADAYEGAFTLADPGSDDGMAVLVPKTPQTFKSNHEGRVVMQFYGTDLIVPGASFYRFTQAESNITQDVEFAAGTSVNLGLIVDGSLPSGGGYSPPRLLFTASIVRFATTTNDSLSGLAARDGVTPIAGDRGLVKDQTLPANNGIYVAASGAWTRATDFNAWAEFPGAVITVTEGTANIGTLWRSTVAAGGTLETTPITFASFTGASLDATLTAFAALTIAANSLTIGTGADAFSQTTFAVNTFPARASTGSLEAKTITDSALTAIAIAVGSAGGVVTFNGAGGTPSSMVGTNITGTASGLTAGNVTTNANLTGDVTSVGNASTLATVNGNVGSFGSATASVALTVNAKGLVTAASASTITPAVGSITGLGTGVATALAVNVGSAGALVAFNGALGTPSSGSGANLTDINASNISSGTLADARNTVSNTTTTSMANLATVGTIASGTWNGADIAVADGGTGRSTGTTAYALVATGTTATGAQQSLASGATTEILVGGGASALPVWTTATGTGAPVRAGSPTFTGSPALSTATATSINSAVISGSGTLFISGAIGSLTVGSAVEFSSPGFIGFGAANVDGSMFLNGFALTVPATGTAALLGTANVFTAAQTLTGGAILTTNTLLSGSGDDVLLTRTAQNANGATFGLYLNATPISGRIGEFHFYGLNSTPAKTQYAAIYSESEVTTAASETGSLWMNAKYLGADRPFFTASGVTAGYVQLLAGFAGSSSNIAVDVGYSATQLLRFSSSSATLFGHPLILESTTDSTNKDTGCLILQGGLGVEKAVNIGTTLAVTGASTLTGGLIGGVQALSGAGAINLTTTETHVTTTGASQALTLANGTAGQIKILTHSVDGGDFILTPTTALGFTTYSSTTAGDMALLTYTAAGWTIIARGGTVA